MAEIMPCFTRLSTIATLSVGEARDQMQQSCVMWLMSSSLLYSASCWSFLLFTSCTESVRCRTSVGARPGFSTFLPALEACASGCEVEGCLKLEVKRWISPTEDLRPMFAEFWRMTSMSSSCRSLHRLATSFSLSFSLMMPTCLPIAIAVGRWSPVIITTRMNASCAILMLGGTDDLGGSKMPHSPKNARLPVSNIILSRASPP
mmetsp:Transcript_63226/g.175969  ORF Transcript_63226/g.175969 Transcript_63226/m.175969 type:complete len:204 (-) Transcript_63226:369-980(-)